MALTSSLQNRGEIASVKELSMEMQNFGLEFHESWSWSSRKRNFYTRTTIKPLSSLEFRNHCSETNRVSSPVPGIPPDYYLSTKLQMYSSRAGLQQVMLSMYNGNINQAEYIHNTRRKLVLKGSAAGPLRETPRLFVSSLGNLIISADAQNCSTLWFIVDYCFQACFET